MRGKLWWSVCLVVALALAGLATGAMAQEDIDSDADGLTDADETNIYGTDPMDEDTDDDGLGEGDEVMTWGTDPLDTDTDDDDLGDAYEVNVVGTNPLAADSDEGGCPDGAEVAGGFDPWLAGDDPGCLLTPVDRPTLEGVKALYR